MVSHITIMKGTKNTVEVLILVVMDNGLIPGMKPVFDRGAALS